MAPLPHPLLDDGAVRVRAPEERDVPAMVAACQDPAISRWTRVPSPYTPEDARRFIALAQAEARAGTGVACVWEHGGELAGTLGLMEIDQDSGYGEIGYWTAAGVRGKGLTTRAVVLVRDWAAEQLGLTELEILPHRDNAPSIRVAERAGFEPTGAVVTIRRMPPGKQTGYLVYRWLASDGLAPSAPPD